VLRPCTTALAPEKKMCRLFINRDCASDAKERDLNRFLRFPILDVRVLGVIAAALIALATLGNTDPAHKVRPVRVVRGEHGTQLSSLAFSPTGAHIATTSMAGRVMVRSLESGWETEKYVGFPGYAREVTFSPDGRLLAVAGIAPGVLLWDMSSSSAGEAKPKMALPFERVTAVLFAADGRSVAIVAEQDGTIVLWDLAARQMRMCFRHPSPVTSLAFSPDGRLLAAGGRDDRWLIVWDVESGNRRMQVQDGPGFAAAVAFSPDGALLASARHATHDVCLWDLASGRPRRVFRGHARSVNSVAFSPDGELLATAGNDGIIGLWTVATGHRIELDAQATSLRVVAFSPNGQLLVLATGDDDDLRFWDVAELVRARPDRTTCR
jgi:WD40 repeat protein